MTDAPSTTEAPSTTVAPPTSDAPPTTSAPSTTEAPPTTAVPELTQDSILVMVAMSEGEEPEVRSATLACKPTEGNTHPKAAEACAEMAVANGDIANLTQNAEAQCTDQAQKVVLLVTGTWNGADVHFEKEFANWCAMENAAKDVYRF
ncbi:SSI family serine proteinase inhibitor [Nocardia sp. NPDC127579]|uniref:SSI family serine proteinase inhibitor n=1 Tax=Nocardia sp. NPDC127579 TaxID=3345402 RepID=UPI003639ED3E